ncbi:MAG TPA: diguanylate cyclase, partial [bacterium]|nr:diguanylate cyclase [bacterium]
DKKIVLNIAESIRKAIEDHIFLDATDPTFASITTSIGVAFCPEHANNADDLIEKADYMLYRAKKMGKIKSFINEILGSVLNLNIASYTNRQ